MDQPFLQPDREETHCLKTALINPVFYSLILEGGYSEYTHNRVYQPNISLKHRTKTGKLIEMIDKAA